MELVEVRTPIHNDHANPPSPRSVICHSSRRRVAALAGVHQACGGPRGYPANLFIAVRSFSSARHPASMTWLLRPGRVQPSADRTPRIASMRTRIQANRFPEELASSQVTL